MIRTWRWAAGLIAVAAVGSGCSAAPTGAPDAPTPVQVARDCAGSRVTDVSDAAGLTAALAGAEPGSVIRLAPGVYAGNFTATTPGTEATPVVLCGGRDAVVDGGATDGQYALHLDGASYWQVSGFTVRGGKKGIMADRVRGVLLEGLLVQRTGDEAVHLRINSTDNIVRGNEISDTGLRERKFGEGVYIGSAESNWCELTACGPDRSDRNVVEANSIARTTAESVDIKEGTTGGVLRDNTFSGVGMEEGDSWVDVKGNGWTVADNVGTDAPEDGFQVHEIVDGWGVDNVFTGNTATVDADGYGINVTKNTERNQVTCSNTDQGAGKGLSNIDCTN